MSTASNATGVRHTTYNIASVLHHALRGAETCEKYIADAERDGEQGFADFFRGCSSSPANARSAPRRCWQGACRADDSAAAEGLASRSRAAFRPRLNPTEGVDRMSTQLCNIGHHRPANLRATVVSNGERRQMNLCKVD